ncbi:MAG TPA: DUF2911 domain-containing protein, partial [Planctomycetota bacterium]|nr:DUF2911 domain-containing protein [Planctomycetota bacterium]
GLYNLGCAYALKKEKDAAFEALEKAVAAGFRDAGQMEKDEDLAVLREDDRYKQLVEKLKAMPKGRQALHLTGERKTTRLVFLGEGFRAAQQVAIAYGAPAWSAEYAKNIESGKLDGKRWRFGADFWTTFDSNADLTLNGKAIPAGMYYLALERTKEGGYVLAFLDAAEIRKMKIDPFAVGRTAGKGVEVPMLSEKSTGGVAETLEIAFEPDASDNSVGALTVRFGPYRLTAPYALKIDV